MSQADPKAPTPLIYLTAGEPSGDQIGAYLMQAFKEATGGAVRFAGVGGARMEAEGLKSLFPMSELALMGLEIVPRLPALLRRIRETADDVRARSPDALVTIDAQGFSKRVGKQLAGAPFPIVQYVAPTVWAWKPWRARTIARYLNHLLTIFPFEAQFFDKYGLANTFVGHLAAERTDRATDGPGLRARLGIAPDATVLCVLPGSRGGEVRRHVPLMRETVALLKSRFPGLVCLVPTVPNVADRVDAALHDWPVPVHLLRDPVTKYDAFAASDAALAASGTVTSETSFAGLPTVVMYRINAVAAEIVRYLFKTKWIKFASAVNLVVDREVLPEFIQDRCKPALMAEAVTRLLSDPEARAAQLAGMAEARDLLSVGGERPSRIAARTILALIEEWRKTHGPRQG
ncbi:MAG: lipid-A-disaccharide synthase [Rhodospirillaceae bacterium]|nr:lipid-A-disaccharide synthase [Rhodospirillaceae bacterium]